MFNLLAMAELKMEKGWKTRLEKLFQKKPLADIRAALLQEKKYAVYPPGPMIFAAFDHTPWDSSVVILQDPYHGPWLGHGLCFSVETICNRPTLLKEHLKELRPIWAVPARMVISRVGHDKVLLLNNVLTVRGESAEPPASGLVRTNR